MADDRHKPFVRFVPMPVQCNVLHSPHVKRASILNRWVSIEFLDTTGVYSDR